MLFTRHTHVQGDDIMAPSTKLRSGFGYIRVSTHDQEELSPDSQERILRDYAKANNIDAASYKAAPADISNITPSAFSVKDLPNNYIDSVRAPFGEIIAYAKENKMNADASGEVAVISTIDAKKPVKSNGQIIQYMTIMQLMAE